MGAFAVYTFVAGLVLFASYIMYKWLLSSENQPAFNRAVLLAIYAIAFTSWPVLEMCHTAVPELNHGDIQIGDAAVTIQQGTSSTSKNWVNILLWVYAAGMAVVFIWTVSTVVRLFKLIRSGEKIQTTNYTLVLIDREDIAPFSWGRYVVMSRSEEKDAAEMILRHEQSHISSLHFIDLVIAQAVCIVQWYNPAAWLMMSELKSVHEYQADSQVLSSGVNARQYQLLLIKKAVGDRFPSLANSLNHSNLKKRITMMCNHKTSAMCRSRALAIVPAVALALALVSIPSVSRAIDRTAATELGTGSDVSVSKDKVTENHGMKQENRDIELKPDVLPDYPGGIQEMMKYLMDNVRYPEAAMKDSIQGRVPVKFTVEADGTITDVSVAHSIDPLLDAEAVRVVKMMPRWIPGEKDGKKVACGFVLPISFKLQE